MTAKKKAPLSGGESGATRNEGDPTTIRGAGNDVLEAATDYTKRGWRVVPIKKGSKRPEGKAWQNLRLEVDDLKRHFPSGDENLGVLLGKPSNGLIDVDLDGEHAGFLASRFLPPTPARFGHRSKPESHWLYTVAEIPDTMQCETPDGAMLVELRSSGAQTVFPPSIHPSGEQYEWDSRGDPAPINDMPSLRTSVKRLSAAVFLAQRWPELGSRNKAALALMGALIRAGWEDDDVKEFVVNVAEAAGDEQASERIESFGATKSKIAAGNVKVTGWPKLGEFVGKDTLAKVLLWLDIESASTKKAQADVLFDFAQEGELFHDASGKCYATITHDEHRETWALGSTSFRRWLTHRHKTERGKVPSNTALEAAIRQCEAEADMEGEEHPTYTRVAEHDGAIYIDLVDDEWQVVKITGEGWTVVPSNTVPVRFVRHKGMEALPVPLSGGDLAELRQFIHVKTEEDFSLVLGFALCALRVAQNMKYPILVHAGEQDSGKSVSSRVTKKLIDPATSELRSEQREPRDLMISATHSHCLAFDNLSYLPAWFSDALCRLSTGGGFAVRMHYEDDDEIIFEAQRPVILNGIGDIATRGDLLDRTMIVESDRVPDDERREEAEFWSAFEAAYPKFLGALYDAAVIGLRALPKIRLASSPRMADAARWVVACEAAMPWAPGTFLAAYQQSREHGAAIALDSDVLVPAMRRLTADFQGTTAELLDQLDALTVDVVKRSKEWPKNARALSSRLRRLAPSLRKVGFEIEFEVNDPQRPKERVHRITSPRTDELKRASDV